MGMRRVRVADDNVLCPVDPHTPHIFPGDLHHPKIRHLRSIVRMKRKRYMPGSFGNRIMQQRLVFEVGDHSFQPLIIVVIAYEYPFAGDQSGMIVFKDIFNHSPQRFALREFADHRFTEVLLLTTLWLVFPPSDGGLRFSQ